MKAGDAAQVAQTAQAAQAAGGGAASTKVLTDTGAAVVTFATEEHAVAVAPTWVEPSPAERKYAEESAANLFNICHKGIAPEIAKFRELLSTGVDIRHKVRPSCVCGEGVVHMCVFVRVHPSEVRACRCTPHYSYYEYISLTHTYSVHVFSPAGPQRLDGADRCIALWAHSRRS